MPDKLKLPFTQIRIGRFLFLLITLLLLFAFRPFFVDLVGVSLIMEIFFSAIFLAGIYAASQNKHIFYSSLIIAIPALIISWTNLFVEYDHLVLVGRILGIFFYVLIATVILIYLFKEKEISPDVIIGSICAYLLIGLLWSNLYAVLETLTPGSFMIPEGLGTEPSYFLYYSFVTMTTLGYGDITPLSPPAQSLSLLEAIGGQLYIAILIARLVGIHIAQSLNK